MKPNTEKHESLAPLITESERVISEAIKHFGLTVPPSNILLTIQSKGRHAAYGWFWNGRWSKKVDGKKNVMHEINLCAEYLKEKNMGEVLIHELAHAENDFLGVQDCSGKRHNKKFKAMAERLGLVVKDPDKRVGYGYTDLGDGATKFLEKIAFKRELFELFRGSQLSPETKKGAGSRLVKCECSGCGYVIRTTRKWIDETGLPTCACGEEFLEAV